MPTLQVWYNSRFVEIKHRDDGRFIAFTSLDEAIGSLEQALRELQALAEAERLVRERAKAQGVV